MRLHRFYIEGNIGGKTEVNVEQKALLNQLRNVFRLKSGDNLVLFDGSGSDFVCRITDISKERAALHIEEVVASKYMPMRKISLYASVIKKDKFEWIVEKATELGVSDIIPILSDRSEKKDVNMDRLNKIAVEAGEQCGRGNVPIIHPVETLDTLISQVALEGATRDSGYNAVFHTDADILPRSGLGTKIKPLNMSDIGIFIGPEGGWTDREIAMFRDANIDIRGLDRQILRAETAAIVALSLFCF
ncbi:MAG: 16S rRNA (uracil(1498)-N(3))-methyltransferase [Patescibacteria group bacterium]|nr:16S rRNA (uracil(1498)-N(3))-methyltransferase [Patescibacteria group bacterium]